jgi:hypothetical protein
MAKATNVDQLALDEKVIEDATIEKLLETRQKARDVASLAAAKAKTASEAAAAAVETLDIGTGAAIRIGRFRIERTFREAATRSFEIGAKEGTKISLVESDG